MSLSSTARGTNTSNASGTNNLTLAPSGNFAASSLAVLVVSYDNSGSNGADPFGTGSVTDTIGNTWTSQHATLQDPSSASAGIVLRIFTTRQDAGALTTGTTITFTTQTAVTAKVCALWEITAAAGNTAELLTTGTGGKGNSLTPTVTTSSITSGDMVVGAIAYEYGQTPATSDTDTTNGSWSTRQNTNIGSTTSGVSVVTQTKVTTGTATQTYNLSYSTQSDWAAGWISVHETAAADPKTAIPGAASLTITTSAPTVTTTQNQVVTPGAASLAITTSAPTVTFTAHKTVLPGAASLAITTSAPTVFSSDHKTVLPGAASLAITTSAPSVFVSDTKVAVPGAASLSITASAPAVAVTDHKVAVPGAASLTLTPSAPTVAVSDHKVIIPGASALTLQGVPPDVTVTDHQWVVPGPLALVIETFAPEVTSSGQNTVEPGPAELVITMGRPTVTVSSMGAGPWLKENTIHQAYPPRNH